MFLFEYIAEYMGFVVILVTFFTLLFIVVKKKKKCFKACVIMLTINYVVFWLGVWLYSIGFSTGGVLGVILMLLAIALMVTNVIYMFMLNATFMNSR